MNLNELIVKSLADVRKSAISVGIEVSDKITAIILANVIETYKDRKISDETLRQSIDSGFKLAASIKNFDVKTKRTYRTTKRQNLSGDVIPRRPVGRPRKHPLPQQPTP